MNHIPVSACTDFSGNPVKTDQRGVPRPQGSGCDIGAFEYFHSLYLNQAVATDDIIGSVEALSLPAVRQLVLVVPLEGAVDSLNAGVIVPAVILLDGFVDLVKLMQQGGELTSQQATPLITSAQQVVQGLLPAPPPAP